MLLIDRLRAERCRWVRPDGSAVVLGRDGVLRSRAAAGPWVIVSEHASLADATAYVDGLPGTWLYHGSSRDDTVRSPPRETEPRRRRKGESSQAAATLTPAQAAEIEARILAHEARVSAELERLRGNRNRRV